MALETQPSSSLSFSATAPVLNVLPGVQSRALCAALAGRHWLSLHFKRVLPEKTVIPAHLPDPKVITQVTYAF